MSSVSRVDWGRIARFMPEKDQSRVALVSKAFFNTYHPRMPESFPVDVWRHIFSYLGPYQAYMYASVCKDLELVALDQSSELLARLEVKPMGNWTAKNLPTLQHLEKNSTERLKAWSLLLGQIANRSTVVDFLDPNFSPSGLGLFQPIYCPIADLENQTSSLRWFELLVMQLPSLRDLSVLSPKEKSCAIQVLLCHHCVEGNVEALFPLLDEKELNIDFLVALSFKSQQPKVAKKLLEYVKAKDSSRLCFDQAYDVAIRQKDFSSVQQLVQEKIGLRFHRDLIEWVLRNYDFVELQELLSLLTQEQIDPSLLASFLEMGRGLLPNEQVEGLLRVLERNWVQRFPDVPIPEATDEQILAQIQQVAEAELAETGWADLARRIAPIALSLLAIGVYTFKQERWEFGGYATAVVPLLGLGRSVLPRIRPPEGKELLCALLGFAACFLAMRKSNPDWIRTTPLAIVPLIMGNLSSEISFEEIIRTWWVICAGIMIGSQILES